ncbi:hypothetical protein HDU82_008064 [Entophlyctis luteolus]|nr:hypothetical protein HDU82_008064 [Entophlyctis luteolus]
MEQPSARKPPRGRKPTTAPAATPRQQQLRAAQRAVTERRRQHLAPLEASVAALHASQSAMAAASCALRALLAAHGIDASSVPAAAATAAPVVAAAVASSPAQIGGGLQSDADFALLLPGLNGAFDSRAIQGSKDSPACFTVDELFNDNWLLPTHSDFMRLQNHQQLVPPPQSLLIAQTDVNASQMAAGNFLFAGLGAVLSNNSPPSFNSSLRSISSRDSSSVTPTFSNQEAPEKHVHHHHHHYHDENSTSNFVNYLIDNALIKAKVKYLERSLKAIPSLKAKHMEQKIDRLLDLFVQLKLTQRELLERESEQRAESAWMRTHDPRQKQDPREALCAVSLLAQCDYEGFFRQNPCVGGVWEEMKAVRAELLTACDDRDVEWMLAVFPGKRFPPAAAATNSTRATQHGRITEMDT